MGATRFADIAGDFAFHPENILALDARQHVASVGVFPLEDSAAATNMTMIHKNEPTRRHDTVVIVEGYREFGADDDLGHIVAGNVVAARPVDLAQRRGVHQFLDGLDMALDFLSRQLQLDFAAHLKVLTAEPEQFCAKHVGLDRRVRFLRADLAALDKNLFSQCDPDRFVRARPVALWAVPTLYALDGADLVAR